MLYTQVWYQNSRARERKGQFRQNMQIINKKCPYCSAIFKVKSALESHLQIKHPEKQMINIDLIPDVKFNSEHDIVSSTSSVLKMCQDPSNMMIKFPQLDGTLPSETKLDLSSHLLQLTSGLHVPSFDMDRSESVISFSDSNFDQDSNDAQEHPADNDQFYISSPASSTQSQPPQTPAISSLTTTHTFQPDQSPNAIKKRNRTSVSRLQVNILRHVFRDIKNPTMTDCFNIGQEIGLTKRVIQVNWCAAQAPEQKKFWCIENIEESRISIKSFKIILFLINLFFFIIYFNCSLTLLYSKCLIGLFGCISVIFLVCDKFSLS